MLCTVHSKLYELVPGACFVWTAPGNCGSPHIHSPRVPALNTILLLLLRLFQRECPTVFGSSYNSPSLNQPMLLFLNSHTMVNCPFIIGRKIRYLNQILRGKFTELSVVKNDLRSLSVLHIDVPEFNFIGVIQQIRN